MTDVATTLRQRISECMVKKLPPHTCLTEHGIYTTDAEDLKELEGAWMVRLIEDVPRLLKEIPLLFQKIGNGKHYWNTNSATGKDKIEEWRKYKNEKDVATSEGSFIIAMLLLDFEYRPNNERKFPHLVFNASFRNLKKETCECGLEYTKASEVQHKKCSAHLKLMENKKKKSPTPPPMTNPPPLEEVHPLKYFAWTQGC